MKLMASIAVANVIMARWRIVPPVRRTQEFARNLLLSCIVAAGPVRPVLSLANIVSLFFRDIKKNRCIGLQVQGAVFVGVEIDRADDDEILEPAFERFPDVGHGL